MQRELASGNDKNGECSRGLGYFVELPSWPENSRPDAPVVKSYVAPWDVLVIQETFTNDKIPKAKVLCSKHGGATHWLLVVGLRPQEIRDRVEAQFARSAGQAFWLANQVSGLEGLFANIVKMSKEELRKEAERFLDAALKGKVQEVLEEMAGRDDDDTAKRTKAETQKRRKEEGRTG